MLTMDSLELGMILWESIPEQDKVAQRQVTTYGRMQDLRGDKVKEWLYVRVDGGFMGLGEQLVADELNTRYFETREEADADCHTRREKYVAEHRRQIEREAADLARRLKELD